MPWERKGEEFRHGESQVSFRYDSQSGGEREIQRTMLELLNQLDGFDSRGDVKVIMATNRFVHKISYPLILSQN